MDGGGPPGGPSAATFINVFGDSKIMPARLDSKVGMGFLDSKIKPARLDSKVGMARKVGLIFWTSISGQFFDRCFGRRFFWTNCLDRLIGPILLDVDFVGPICLTDVLDVYFLDRFLDRFFGPFLLDICFGVRFRWTVFLDVCLLNQFF